MLLWLALDLSHTMRMLFVACGVAESPREGSAVLQVIRVLVVRLQQQALRWTAGATPHKTGRSQRANAAAQMLVQAD